jgi:hypothetical protein
MKRCPECDFLYEDDQRLCDMDGIALVHDPRVFPANSSMSAGHAAKHIWQRLAIAFPLTVLAALAFYVLQHQPGLQASHPAAVVISSESPIGQPASNDAAPTSTMHAAGTMDSSRASERPQRQGEVQEAPQSEAGPSAPESTKGSGQGTDVNSREDAPEANPPAALKSNEKPVKPQASPRRRASANEAEKDSKITSLLKKTGRILKKPFKL